MKTQCTFFSCVVDAYVGRKALMHVYAKSILPTSAVSARPVLMHHKGNPTTAAMFKWNRPHQTVCAGVQVPLNRKIGSHNAHSCSKMCKKPVNAAGQYPGTLDRLPHWVSRRSLRFCRAFVQKMPRICGARHVVKRARYPEVFAV